MDTTKTKRTPAAALPSGVVYAFPTARPRRALPALPFYPEAAFMPCEGGTGIAIHWRDYRLTLNNTNDPIYWLNQLGALRLTKTTVIPYARFFFSQVRNSTGCFDLVEPDDPINWLPGINPAHKEQVRNHLCPLRHHAVDAGWHRVSGTVIYSNYERAALYRTDIRIAARTKSGFDPNTYELDIVLKGQFQLCNEELLVDDLGIVMPVPPAR